MSIGTELRAVFYARVSTEEEKQLNALEKQIHENKDVIRDHGWRLVGEYIDEGKTGTTTKRRNDYKRLLKDMTENKFDIVVCKDQDRLQRNTLAVSYTHLRAHETGAYLVCRLLLEKKKNHL